MSRKRIEAGGAYVGLGIRSKLKAGLRKASNSLRKFGKSAIKVGGVVTAAGGSIAAGFSVAIFKASEFQERFSKFTTVFGKNAGAMKQWADTFGAEVGRSKSDLVDFLGSTQDLLVPMGIDPATAEETSKQITKLTVDLASFNNKADADVLRDIQAALTGSGEVMKKYGVIVSQTAVNQELLNTGLDPKAATEAQKATARLSIIMKGTTAAQGDALRTAGSFANRMKALKASFSNFLVDAGTPLLDVLANLAGYLTGAIQVVGSFMKANSQLVMIVAGVALGLVAAGGALVAVGTAATVLPVIISGVATAFGVLASILGAVVSPVGLIIAGVVAAAAAFLTLTDTGKNVVNWFSSNFMLLIEAVTSTLKSIFNALQGGDLGLAAKIGFTAIKLAVASIMQEVEGLFGVSFEKMFQTVAKLGKAIAKVLARLNVARQKGTNWIAEQIGKVALDAEGRKALSGINQGALNDARGLVDRVDDFDADKFGSDLRSSFDVGDLSAELAKLKEEAANLKDEAETTPPALADGLKSTFPAIGAAAAELKNNFSNFASLSGRSAARGGPGAKSMEKKILKTLEDGNEKSDKIVDAIYETSPTFT